MLAQARGTNRLHPDGVPHSAPARQAASLTENHRPRGGPLGLLLPGMHGGAMTDEEATALRRIIKILSKVSTVNERRIMAMRIEEKISGKDSSQLAYSLPHAAALFFPSDADKARAVKQLMESAFDAGDLVTVIPKEHRHILLSDLAAWPHCPAVSADSPLRYWLPDCPVDNPHGKEPAQSEPQRRLNRLLVIGGSAVKKSGGWKFKLSDELIRLERAEGRPRSSPKTIREDLRAAAQAAEDERRAGILNNQLLASPAR